MFGRIDGDFAQYPTQSFARTLSEHGFVLFGKLRELNETASDCDLFDEAMIRT